MDVAFQVVHTKSCSDYIHITFATFDRLVQASRQCPRAEINNTYQTLRLLGGVDLFQPKLSVQVFLLGCLVDQIFIFNPLGIDREFQKKNHQNQYDEFGYKYFFHCV